MRLFNDDYKNILKELPDNSIDTILTDPPYNIAQFSSGNIKFNSRKEINCDIAEWDKEELNPELFLPEFKRILKPNGNLFIFCSHNLIGKYHAILQPLFERTTLFVWHKTNPAPQVRKVSFLNACEYIICAWNKGHKWNFKKQIEMHNFFESPICMGKERIKHPFHPTQKPLKILKHLINISTDKGDTVLDSFMGLGSTGVACKEIERKFIGIEINKEYFECAERRINHTSFTRYEESNQTLSQSLIENFIKN